MERGEAVIHIINKFKVRKENPSFRCILIYQDLETGFCIIRPLLYKIDLEISMELFKIFTTYGPPSELYINSCTQEMINNMYINMKTLYPMFDLKFTKKNVGNYGIAMKVVTKLHEWMEVTKKEEWEIGCLIIQKQINMEHSADLKSTPQDLFFKKGKVIQTDVAENVKSSNTSQEQRRSYTKQEPSVQEEQLKNVNQEQKSNFNSTPVESSLNLGSVRIKEEIEDYGDIAPMKQRLVMFEDGLIFSGLRKPDTNVEVKMERLDE